MVKNVSKRTWVRFALVAMVALAIGATASASSAGKARQIAPHDTAGGPYSATVSYIGPFPNQNGEQLTAHNLLNQVVRKVFTGPGDWAVTATANLIERGGNDDETRDLYCQLRGSAGNVIGSASDRRFIPEDGKVEVSLSVNGLFAVGPTGGTISLRCASDADYIGLDEAQMMLVQVGGFS